MAEEYIKGTGKGRGGWRGGKRPLKENPLNQSFNCRCTAEEKEKLKEFLKQLRNKEG